MLKAEVTAEPTIIDGITLSGSAAANGIAPSVIMKFQGRMPPFLLLFLLL